MAVMRQPAASFVPAASVRGCASTVPAASATLPSALNTAADRMAPAGSVSGWASAAVTGSTEPGSSVKLDSVTP